MKASQINRYSIRSTTRIISLAAINLILSAIAIPQATSRFVGEFKPIFSSGHSHSIDKVFFSSDGKRIISGIDFNAANRSIRVWDIEKGAELRIISVEKKMHLIDYSPATDTVAAAGFGTEIVLWNARTGKITQRVNVKTPAPIKNKIVIEAPGKKTEYQDLKVPNIDSIHLSPDGKILVIQNHDGLILWDVERKNVLRRIQTSRKSSSSVDFVGFSPDSSRTFLLKDEKVYIQNSITGKPLKSFETNIHFATDISPKGTFLLSGGGGGVGISKDFWDLATGKLVKSLKPENRMRDGFRHVVFSPDESIIAVAKTHGWVRLFDPKTMEMILDFGKEAESAETLVFSPDGKTLVTNGIYGNLRHWDVKTGKLLKTFGKSNNGIYSFDLDANGRSMVVTDENGKIRMLDLSERAEAKNIDIGSDFASLGIFSPNGKFLAVAAGDAAKDNDHKIHIFDRASGKKISDITVGRSLVSMAFSENGKLIASGTRTADIHLWDSRSGKLIYQFKYSDPNNYSDNTPIIALSPNGNWLAAAGTNEPAIRVLNVKTGEAFNFENENAFADIKFSSDSRTLAAIEDGYMPLDGIVLFDVVERKRIRKLGQDKKVNITNSSAEPRYDDEETLSPPALNFSPNGKYVAGSTDGRDIKIWDVGSGKQIKFDKLPQWLNLTDGFVLHNIQNRKILMEFVDGRLDFSDAHTHKLLASLYIYGENDWAVRTPDGRFDASDGSLDYIHFTDGSKILLGNEYKSEKFRRGLLREVLGY